MNNQFDITTLSDLSRIHLSEEEKDSLSRDLENILTYVKKLDEVDTSSVQPTSHVLNIENVFREDQTKKTGAADTLLENLPDERKDGRFFKVPKIITDAE